MPEKRHGAQKALPLGGTTSAELSDLLVEKEVSEKQMPPKNVVLSREEAALLLQTLRALRDRGAHLDVSTVAAVASGIIARARQDREVVLGASGARNWLCAHALENL